MFLRMALCGPSGTGKTLTALRFAHCLSAKIAVVDTEHGSVRKYIGDVYDGNHFAFDVVEPGEFSPDLYASLIKTAVLEGFDVVILDSLSHAWDGIGGALDQVDKSTETFKFAAWKSVTPKHRMMIETILSSQIHVIATMRSKTEYHIEKNAQGRNVPVRVGLAPVQRSGIEFEFDVVADMNQQHDLTVTATRCSAIDNVTVNKPGREFFTPVLHWLKGKPMNLRPPETPADNVGTVNIHGLCTTQQQETVKRYAGEMKMPLKALKAAIARRTDHDGTPCTTLSQLSYLQAEEFIAKLAEVYRANEKVPF